MKPKELFTVGPLRLVRNHDGIDRWCKSTIKSPWDRTDLPMFPPGTLQKFFPELPSRTATRFRHGESDVIESTWRIELQFVEKPTRNSMTLLVVVEAVTTTEPRIGFYLKDFLDDKLVFIPPNPFTELYLSFIEPVVVPYFIKKGILIGPSWMFMWQPLDKPLSLDTRDVVFAGFDFQVRHWSKDDE